MTPIWKPSVGQGSTDAIRSDLQTGPGRVRAQFAVEASAAVGFRGPVKKGRERLHLGNSALFGQ